jgi:uncharacterized Zn ribbon protein
MNGRSGRIGKNEELECGTANTGQNVGQSCKSCVVRWESAAAPNDTCCKTATEVSSGVKLRKRDIVQFMPELAMKGLICLLQSIAQRKP